MTINIYSTRNMVRALEQMKPARTFLLDTFFTDVEYHTARTVDIDIVKGKRRIAAFVSPRAEGTLVEKIGYQTKTYSPPYIKPKDVIDAEMLTDRLPGETIYQGNNPASREQIMLGKMLADFDDQIVRREEWMAAQGIVSGQIDVVGEGVDDTIDFSMMGSHKVELTGTDVWTDSEHCDPLGDLRTWRRLIMKDSGVQPDVVIMGSSAIDAFLASENVQNALDLRRVDVGAIDPKTLPDGVVYWGYLKDVGVDIYSYDEWYIDADDNEQPMIPVNRVVMGSTKARAARHYGLIMDVEAGVNMVGARYPKSWTTPDPGERWVMLQSSPLIVPHQIDAFISAKVLAD